MWWRQFNIYEWKAHHKSFCCVSEEGEEVVNGFDFMNLFEETFV